MKANTTTIDVPQTTTLVWLKCSGYFSRTVHAGEHWIGVQDGTIRAIRKSPPASDERVESAALESYVVPLLADTHVHFYLQPWPRSPEDRVLPASKPVAEEIEDAKVRVQHALRQGVGLLRDMGDPHGINLAVRQHFRGSGLPVPELIVAGPGLYRPKKYGRFLGVMKESVADIKAAIDELVTEEQVDYIKLVTTGIVDFTERRVKQSPQFTQGELNEVVKHAHGHGRKVAAHCSGADGLELAIEAGVDFIEHGYFINEVQVGRIIEKGLVWTPTLVPVFAQKHAECGWSAETIASIDLILAEHNCQIARARKSGCKLLTGTDAGCPGVDMGGGIRTELACLNRSDFSAAELLKMATVTAAELCKARNYTGRLEVGDAASFGVYRRAPWENIENLNSLSSVYYDGRSIE